MHMPSSATVNLWLGQENVWYWYSPAYHWPLELYVNRNCRLVYMLTEPRRDMKKVICYNLFKQIVICSNKHIIICSNKNLITICLNKL